MKNEDLISRQQAIDAVKKNTFKLKFVEEQNYESSVAWSTKAVYSDLMEEALLDLPTIQLDTTSADYISRQAAIDALRAMQTYKLFAGDDMLLIDQAGAQTELMMLPSAQPERTCVNCGRTANNGGWYEDGRTRCPIEEHYALPKDGYCHLWEKRKDWEDDYVKRAEEGEK